MAASAVTIPVVDEFAHERHELFAAIRGDLNTINLSAELLGLNITAETRAKALERIAKAVAKIEAKLK